MPPGVLAIADEGLHQKPSTSQNGGCLKYAFWMRSFIGLLFNDSRLLGQILVETIFGTIARPVMAMPAPMHTGIASDQAMVDGTAMAMPEDMPCCPTKAPIPD